YLSAQSSALAWTMWCSVRVHTGGNRAKPPQARKARRPTTADRTSVLCITSPEFGGSGGPSLTSERMAGNYWNTFAPGATHLSSPTSATKSAKSRHNAAQQKGACRGFAGHLLLFDPVQAPPLGHAFESVNAAILK